VIAIVSEELPVNPKPKTRSRTDDIKHKIVEPHNQPKAEIRSRPGPTVVSMASEELQAYPRQKNRPETVSFKILKISRIMKISAEW
jgi:hypothetical protein